MRRNLTIVGLQGVKFSVCADVAMNDDTIILSFDDLDRLDVIQFVMRVDGIFRNDTEVIIHSNSVLTISNLVTTPQSISIINE